MFYAPEFELKIRAAKLHFYCTIDSKNRGRSFVSAESAIIAGPSLASIPGRVFAFITVRRTTGPGTSCLRMRQIFIVYLWSAKIFNKSIIEICTQKMHRVSTQKMHIGSCFTKAWGVASCAAAQLQ